MNKTHSMKEKDRTGKSIRIKTLAIGGVAIASLFIVVTAIFVYFFPQNTMAMRVRMILPYPAVAVSGTHLISFGTIDHNMSSIRRFYESQSDDLSQAGLRVDFSTPDGKKRLMIREKELLNKMVEDEAIRILAQKRDIEISSEEVSKTVDRKISTLDNNKEDVVKQLNRLYGWDIDDFEQKIVRPEMYKEALTRVYSQGLDISSQAKKKIEDAKQDMSQGMSFEDASKKYSDGKTAQDGGELGWVPLANMTPEIKQVIEKQKINQVSGIIESPLGFHIVAIEERKQEQGQDVVRLKQIFTKKTTFSDWLTDQMKQMNIVVLFKGYMWDKETARVEFKQPEMKLFEENALQKSQGDASLLF